jgi:hypothetical protein
MDIPNQERDAALEELRKQGLTIRLHNVHNDTWHVADGGLYGGYVVTVFELVDLKRLGKLHLPGIKALG